MLGISTYAEEPSTTTDNSTGEIVYSVEQDPETEDGGDKQNDIEVVDENSEEIEIDFSDSIFQTGGFPKSDIGTNGSENGAFEETPKNIKSLENKICTAIKNREETINVEEYEISSKRLFEIIIRLINDEPQFFYVRGLLSCKTAYGNVITAKLRYRPEYDEQDIADYYASLENIVNKMPKNISQTEKALFLHDALILNTDYDYSFNKFNAYNALVEGSSVCQGYALAYKGLCDLAGIQCAMVYSDSIYHAWNLVTLTDVGNEPVSFYVDCTWDDMGGSGVSHKNFLASREALIATGHNSSDWKDTNNKVIYEEYNDTRYDKAVFKNAKTALTYENGVWTFMLGDQKQIYDYSGKTTAMVVISMYRLYNPNSGEHFYTGSMTERDNLVRCGWRYEGVGFKTPKKSNTPVYRLYNPNAGDHHYTCSASERDYLVSVGWKYEGIGWYSNDYKEIPIYRLYNPNAKTGTHHYTASSIEKNHLVSLGWKYEGIAFYACK